MNAIQKQSPTFASLGSFTLYLVDGCPLLPQAQVEVWSMDGGSIWILVLLALQKGARILFGRLHALARGRNHGTPGSCCPDTMLRYRSSPCFATWPDFILASINIWWFKLTSVEASIELFQKDMRNPRIPIDDVFKRGSQRIRSEPKTFDT